MDAIIKKQTETYLNLPYYLLSHYHTLMTDNQEPKHLYAIVRKPQEGKTFICLENINRTPNTIHLIITMNTIKSNRQFFLVPRNDLEHLSVFSTRSRRPERKLKGQPREGRIFSREALAQGG